MKVSRVHRLLKLITLLQSGGPYLADELARGVEVSRRTVFRDLNLLKLAGVPVLFDRASRRYTIEKEFFLPPVNLTLAESLALMVMLKKSVSQAALPNYDSVASALLKIESAMPRRLQEHCAQALDTIDIRPSPTSDARRAVNAFHTLWYATRNRESVDVLYDSYFERAEIRTRLRPYRLTFMLRGWYVIGYSSLHKEVRTFKVERVLDLHPTGKSFQPDPSFDPATHFKNAWLMIPGDKTYRVRIRFSPKIAGNVEEVLWHPTQETRWLEDGSLLFDVKVDGVNEIAWWVLGYGKEAVVERPHELRRIIAEHIGAMAAAYNGQ